MRQMTAILPELPETKPDWATDTQWRYVEAQRLHKTQRAAAAALGVAPNALWESIDRLKKAGARHGYAPGHFEGGVAPGFAMGKVTVQRGPGGVERTWERQHPAQQHISREIEALAAHVMADVKGMSPMPKGPLLVSTSLLAQYCFGDPHFGLGSSSDDGGDDTSIDDADRLTRAGIDALVARTPATEKAVLVFIGDNLHANDNSALTPQSRNPLDVDPRGFGAAFLSCARAICYATVRALTKHSSLDVWIMPGNHDPDAAFGIAVAVSMFFDNDARVNVRLSRDHLWWMRFGKNLLAACHGDRIKPADVHGVLSNDCQEVWHLCDFRYVVQGHIHHDVVMEYQRTRIEFLRTLAKSDPWHRGKGYRSMRDTRAIVYHESYGEAERYTVSAAMLEDALAA